MRFKDPDVALIQPEKNEAWNVLELRTLNGQCFEERGHQVLIFWIVRAKLTCGSDQASV